MFISIGIIEQKAVVHLSITTACRFLGVSRQAYYQRIARQQRRMRHEQKVLAFVQTERLHQPRIGTRKLLHLMSLAKLYIGRDRLFALLREYRLLVPNKHAHHRTTQSHHRFHCHPNIIKSGIELIRPEQLWVADITYLPTHEGEAYLSLVTDAYSRKVVGYHVDDNLKTSSVKQAFSKALKHKKTSAKLIHHSDRGIQYCSREY